jgi:hypothetical protein
MGRYGRPGQASGYESYFLNARSRVRVLQAQAQLAETQLGEAERRLALQDERVRSGAEPVASADEAKSQLVQRKIVFEAVKAALQDAMFASSLAQPVDVDLKASTITQAAEALSRASGVQIVVVPALRVAKATVGPAPQPSDVRVTLKSSGVPLAAVLEAIAEGAPMLIAPGDHAVVLKPVPTMDVNGEKRWVHPRTTPWSDEWGAEGRSTALQYAPSHPLNRQSPMWGGILEALGRDASSQALRWLEGGLLSPNAYLGQLEAGGAARLTEPASGSKPTEPALAPKGTPGSGFGAGERGGAPGSDPSGPPPTEAQERPGGTYWDATAPDSDHGGVRTGEQGAISVAALGPDQFIVSEPGVGPKGEAGAWLTTYRRTAGGQWAKGTGWFHRSIAASSRPGQDGGAATPGSRVAVVLQLKHAKAVDVVRKLKGVTRSQNRTLGPGITSLTADPRRNAIVALGTPAAILVLKRAVERADVRK